MPQKLAIARSAGLHEQTAIRMLAHHYVMQFVRMGRAVEIQVESTRADRKSQTGPSQDLSLQTDARVVIQRSVDRAA